MTDFNFSLDLCAYVSQQWWRVAVIPSKETIKAGEYVTLRDAIEQYTRSERNIKQIICQKQLVGWNFAELTDKIKAIIYSTGYRSHINVVSGSRGVLFFNENFAFRVFPSLIIESLPVVRPN